MKSIQHLQYKSRFNRNICLLAGSVIIGCLILSINLLWHFSPVYSAPLSLPVDLQTPIFTTMLQGGYSFRASPTIADVLTGPNYPGLEIVVGSAATTPAQGSYPASVALIKSDGSIIWEKLTYTWNGAIYSIGTVTSSPAVGDIDGDGQMDIVVGMGGFSDPVTRGGIIALNGSDGSLKWYVATKSLYDGNNIPDGVYASPSIADFDGDGKNEIVVGAGDHYLWLIDGTAGTVEPGFPINMWDTVNSSTAVADLDGDGWPDFSFGSDFTNAGVTPGDDVPQLPPDGGVMRGMKYRNGQFYLPGWDQCVSSVWTCTPDPAIGLLIPIGQWIDQTPYSSPAIGDIDKDGQLEIISGSGFYWSPQTKGHWVKIWRADGTLLKTLDTNGVTFASPALGDLNNDGFLDIVIGSLQMSNNAQGIYSGIISGPSTLYAWSGNPADNFAYLWPPQTIGTWRDAAPLLGMFSSPIIADIDPGQAGPEILFGFDTELVVFSGGTGAQLTYVAGGVNKPTLATYGFFENSPAVADINNDGKLEIVITNDYAVPIGTPRTWRQHVVAWQWPGAGNNAADADLPWPMFRRDPAHHAFLTVPTLKVTPTQFNLFYQYGSGDPNPATNITVENLYNSKNMTYTISYSQSTMSIGGPTSGVIGPSASLQIPFVVSASQQITGTYSLGIEVQASSEGKALVNSPNQIPITLHVGDISQIYLPILLK